MSLGGRVYAAVYDRLIAGAEQAGLGEHRRRLLEGARGRVLEIGAGTGANLQFYGEGVDEIVLSEPEEPMARRLERRAGGFSLPARIVRAPAEELPLEDARFDVVVATLVLCTVKDPVRALAEIRRVLAPGGRLLFMEHVRSDDARLARWQDRLNWLSNLTDHGCHCNRPTVESIERAGFSIVRIEHHRFPKAPPFVRPLVIGTAQPI